MRRAHIHPLAALAVALLVASGCRGTNAGAGSDPSGTVPDTVPEDTATTLPATTTTTVLTDEEAAYNVYRAFLDTSLAIGSDFDRNPLDGSLAPYTTPAYRQQIEVNLSGLKLNGVTEKGQLVTRLMSSTVPKPDQLLLKVCSRDDVDQFDRTGKQLSPVGPGKPEIDNVGLVKEGSTWLVDGVGPTGESCDA